MSKQKQQSSFSLSDLKNIRIDEKEITFQSPSPKKAGENPIESSTFVAPNVGWLYYFDYFRQWTDFPKELDQLANETPDKEIMKPLSSHLELKSRELFQLKLTDQKPEKWRLKHLEKEDVFQLTTVYPGLLAGIGYQHETKVEGELKLGFYFDYTSGLPTIPGSTIKGILRSVFRGEHWEFLQEVLEEHKLFKEQFPDAATLKNWELEIFEGISNPDVAEDKPFERYLRPSERDVFHDALIWKSEHDYAYFNGENQHYGKGTFLGQDFITPHHPTDVRFGAFKDPVPLRFMKVLPKVNFLFQFDVKDSLTYPALTKVNKIKLFKALLLTLGAGAKTNVGYGQFTAP